ncbi:MAG: FAD-dependent oxidoreductase [Clostridia bacterium]|nr:FAD-dependent oxidoreductase [Clostridia bacterium]
MLSVWSANSELPSFSQLTGDKKTDVLVVGGGIAGLLCAYMLKTHGVDCILLEADRICRGVTQNTTAKITVQHGFLYDKLLKRFGKEKAQMYLRANERALQNYRALCGKIACDFEEKDNIVYTQKNRQAAERELRALEALGKAPTFEEALPVPIEIAGAVRVPNQAQFNPLKFLAEIAKDLEIYEQTKVFEIRENRAYTAHGTVAAKQFIIATHFPILNKHGGYFLKLYQERSYALALENGPQIDGMYVDEAPKGMSFRNYGDFLLVGGGDHRTGKPGGNYGELRSFAKVHYPACAEAYVWATQDCMSLDGVPYIGRYAMTLPNVYVATGFNKWGMTSSMAAAEILCDMVMGKENDCAPVFSPSRNMLTVQLAVNGGTFLTSILTPTKKRCPHMGCALKWNPTEHTWDCPCHGSRFQEDGKLIENPATDDLKK